MNNIGEQYVIICIKYFSIFAVSKECIGIVVFCIRDYTSQIRIHSNLINIILKNSDCTEDEFKMHKNFIKTRKIISQKEQYVCTLYNKQSNVAHYINQTIKFISSQRDRYLIIT